MKIASVSPFSLVTVEFSDPFVVHKDLQQIKTDQMLIVSIVAAEDQSEDELQFDWQVTSFEETYMLI